MRASLLALALALAPAACFDFDLVTALPGGDLAGADLSGREPDDAASGQTDGPVPGCVSPLALSASWQQRPIAPNVSSDIDRVAWIDGRLFALGSGLIAFDDVGGWVPAVPSGFVDRHYRGAAAFGATGALVVGAVAGGPDPATIVQLTPASGRYTMGAPTAIPNVTGLLDVAAIGLAGLTVGAAASPTSSYFDAQLNVARTDPLSGAPSNVVALDTAFYSCGYDYVASYGLASQKWDKTILPPPPADVGANWYCLHIEVVHRNGGRRFWLTLADELGTSPRLCVVDEDLLWRCKPYPVPVATIRNYGAFASPCDPELAIAVGDGGQVAFVDGSATALASEQIPATTGNLFSAAILPSGEVYASGAAGLVAKRAP